MEECSSIIINISIFTDSGIHSFPLHTNFKKCEHGDLPEDRDKDYLKPGTGVNFVCCNVVVVAITNI